ncbi:hypothetical protein MYAM1_000324 [Malassezia yamatoensis]|uniref:Uncharacterized protein n=1 Tax=Malassezia yamatoensis TaxID=253288 RepID=A0AAJ5YPW3_9BASI|nr:hypothetical protein MYAM1_000324 [Malassezia yamatoensis]
MSQEGTNAAFKAASIPKNRAQTPDQEKNVPIREQDDQKHSAGNELAAAEADATITNHENSSNASDVEQHHIAMTNTSSSQPEDAKTVSSVPVSKTEMDVSSQQSEESGAKDSQGPHTDSLAKYPSSTENSPRLATAHAKKFSSLNINQRFFQSASTVTVKTAQKPAAPQTAPAPVSRLMTKLVQAQPITRTQSPTVSWGSRTSLATSANANAAKDSFHAQSTEAQPARKTGVTRAPWAASTQTSTQPNAQRPSIFMHDFPTAAEALDAERKAEERAAQHAAEEAIKRQAALKELERFRGSDLPAANHWDEMDGESEESLDDVVEFGDGKQYKISHEESEDSMTSHPPESQSGALPAPSVHTHHERMPSEPHVNAWHHPLRSMHTESNQDPSGNRATSATAPNSSAVERTTTRLTWGPLAQRHSILTGEPLPKAPPKSTALSQEAAASTTSEANADDRAKSSPTPAPEQMTSPSRKSPTKVIPAKPEKTPEEMAAEQQSEMMTAAERARKRREEDEQAREAERERARARAQQLEEQLKAAELAKQEALEAEKKAARERRERDHAVREQEARARLAREDMAKERARAALLERQAADLNSSKPSETHQKTNEGTEGAKRNARRDVDILDTWRRSSPSLPTATTRKSFSESRMEPIILHQKGEATGISVLPSVSTSKSNCDTRQNPAPISSTTELMDSVESDLDSLPTSTTQQKSVSSVDQDAAKEAALPAPESATTRCELGTEQAPVWRQYCVQLSMHTHSSQSATRAAKLHILPRDARTHTCSLDPPIGYTTLNVVNTAVDWLFPQEKPEVHLPLPKAQASRSQSASLPKLDHRTRQPHRNRPLDQDRLIEAIVGNSNFNRDRELFQDTYSRRYGGHSQKNTPRVRLPSVTTWRPSRLLNATGTSSSVEESQQAYRHLKRPYTHGNDTLVPPVVSLPGPRIANSSTATWDAGTFKGNSHGSDSHLEQIWSLIATSDPDRSRNSLKKSVHEPLPAPIELHSSDDRPSNSIPDAHPSIPSVSSSVPSTKDSQLSLSWRKLRTSGTPPDSNESRPRTSQATLSESNNSHVLPADYTEFVLSDSW